MPKGHSNHIIIALVLATSTFPLIFGEDDINGDMSYNIPPVRYRRNFLRFGKRSGAEGMAEQEDEIKMVIKPQCENFRNFLKLIFYVKLFGVNSKCSISDAQNLTQNGMISHKF